MSLLFSPWQVVLQLHVFLHPAGCSQGVRGNAVSNYCHIRRQKGQAATSLWAAVETEDPGCQVPVAGGTWLSDGVTRE